MKILSLIFGISVCHALSYGRKSADSADHNRLNINSLGDSRDPVFDNSIDSGKHITGSENTFLKYHTNPTDAKSLSKGFGSGLLSMSSPSSSYEHSQYSSPYDEHNLVFDTSPAYYEEFPIYPGTIDYPYERSSLPSNVQQFLEEALYYKQYDRYINTEEEICRTKRRVVLNMVDSFSQYIIKPATPIYVDIQRLFKHDSENPEDHKRIEDLNNKFYDILIAEKSIFSDCTNQVTNDLLMTSTFSIDREVHRDIFRLIPEAFWNCNFIADEERKAEREDCYQNEIKMFNSYTSQLSSNFRESPCMENFKDVLTCLSNSTKNIAAEVRELMRSMQDFTLKGESEHPSPIIDEYTFNNTLLHQLLKAQEKYYSVNEHIEKTLNRSYELKKAIEDPLFVQNVTEYFYNQLDHGLKPHYEIISEANEKFPSCSSCAFEASSSLHAIRSTNKVSSRMIQHALRSWHDKDRYYFDHLLQKLQHLGNAAILNCFDGNMMYLFKPNVVQECYSLVLAELDAEATSASHKIDFQLMQFNDQDYLNRRCSRRLTKISYKKAASTLSDLSKCIYDRCGASYPISFPDRQTASLKDPMSHYTENSLTNDEEYFSEELVQ